MDKWDKQLLEILNSNHELLAVKPRASANRNADQKLIDSFVPINEFYQTHKREPLPGQVHEAQLYYRLKGIREDSDKVTKLAQHDTFNLLKSAKKEIKSIEDIFASDDFGLLSDSAENIFSFKNIPKETSMPEYVASRKVCTDFADFEQLLKNCQLDLKNGKRKLLPFANEQQISQNCFYVLKGVLLFVAEIGERSRDKTANLMPACAVSLKTALNRICSCVLWQLNSTKTAEE